MATDSLTEALRGLDPARRALLDLSLRHGIRPDDLAEVLGMDSAEIVSLREDALAAIASEGGGDVDRARSALAELPLEEWVASAGSEAPPRQEVGGQGAEPAAEQVPDSQATGTGPEQEQGPEAEHADADAEPEPEHSEVDAEAEHPAAGVEPEHAAAVGPEHAEAEQPAAAVEPQHAAVVGPEHAAAGSESERSAADIEADQAASEDEQDDTEPHGEPQQAPDGELSQTTVGARAERAGPAGHDAMAMNGHPSVSEETPTVGTPTAAHSAPPEATRSRRRRRIGLAVLAAGALIALVVALATSGGNHSSTHRSAPVAPHSVAPHPVAPHPVAPHPVAPPVASTSHSGRLTALGAATGSGAHGIAQLGRGRVLHVTIDGLPSARPGSYQLWLYNSVVDSIPLARFAGSSASLSVTLPPGFRRYRYLDVSQQRSPTNPNPSGVSVLRIPVRTLVAGA